MRVDFGDAFRQMRDELPKPRLGHGAAPGEAEDLIRRGDASPSEAFGEVRGGRLEIEGPFAQIDKEDVIALLQDQSMAQPPPRSNDVQEGYRQILELVNNESKGNQLAEEKWADQLPDEVFAIITFSRDWRITHEERVEGIFYSGLLLRKVDGGYERIAAFMNEDLKWMDQTMALWERKTIVLL